MHVMSAIIGALGGSVATILWDIGIKPILHARSLAEVVAADLSLLARTVAHELQMRETHANTVPISQPFPLELYGAVASRIGDLPTDSLLLVVATYRIFARLNQAAEAARQHHDITLAALSTETQRAAATQLLMTEIAIYASQLSQAKSFVNHVQPMLTATSRPWWSARTWCSPRPKALEKAVVAGDLERTRAAHEAELNRLRQG